MEILTTVLLPHQPYFNSHPKLNKFSHSLSSSNIPHFRFRSRRCSEFVVSQAIRTPKFDFNSRRFDDEGYNFGDSEKRRRRKSDGKSKQRRWWNDELEEEEIEPEIGIFEQVVENLWILQVFKSYGWFLPIILLSFLAATGPKAFLMALSIPFGLSLLIFALERIPEWLEGSSKLRQRRKRRSKFGRRKDASMEEEDDREERSQQNKRNKKRDYQSWIPQNNGDSGSTLHANSFGGWDELVREDETKFARRRVRETSRPKVMVEKERLNRSMEERDMPLLLKLLVSVFPFLASWTNLL